MQRLTLVLATLAGLVVRAEPERSKTAQTPNDTSTNSSSIIYQLSSDSEFAFILEEYLSLASGNGASSGEVLRAASQITPGDYDSWYTEFKFLGDAMHDKATAINATRFPVSARDMYFRAASYYRAADFFLHENQTDPRIKALGKSSTDDFNAAAALLDTPPIVTSLPTFGFDIPIYFFSPAAKPGCESVKRPTVIVGTGYDGSQQALYHSIGRSILERGYNYISYEGPGQPTVRRDQDLGFIGNWWDVITPVVDYLHNRTHVDTDRIALVGESFGGTLAPRAASREHRLSAVVAIDGVTSMAAYILSQLPAELSALYYSNSTTENAEFDEIMLGLMRNSSQPTELRWVIAQGMYSFNTESPHTWLSKLSAITSERDILEKIECPVLVFGAEDDILPIQQSKDVAAILGDKATYYLFKNDVGAGQHCQLGAEAQLAQVTMDWLGDVWGL